MRSLLDIGLAAILFVVSSLGAATIAVAQVPPPAEPRDDAARIVVPRFMDPRVRLERPEQLGLRAIRFLTDDEFPPLHFADPDGNLTGFSVDLARAVCERLAIPCTIQARRFDTLLDALAEGRGDVIAAAIPVTTELRQRFLASATYHRMPARFATARSQVAAPVSPDRLKGKIVAVVESSAHEAYLRAFFPEAVPVTAPEPAAALALLTRREAEYVFADGLTLALWLGSKAGAEHGFAGGPYLESRYFGEGVGFIVRPEDQLLRRSLDYALQQVWDDGTYARLYLRYFPISLY